MCKDSLSGLAIMNFHSQIRRAFPLKAEGFRRSNVLIIPEGNDPSTPTYCFAPLGGLILPKKSIRTRLSTEWALNIHNHLPAQVPLSEPVIFETAMGERRAIFIDFLRTPEVGANMSRFLLPRNVY